MSIEELIMIVVKIFIAAYVASCICYASWHFWHVKKYTHLVNEAKFKSVTLGNYTLLKGEQQTIFIQDIINAMRMLVADNFKPEKYIWICSSTEVPRLPQYKSVQVHLIQSNHSLRNVKVNLSFLKWVMMRMPGKTITNTYIISGGIL